MALGKRRHWLTTYDKKRSVKRRIRKVIFFLIFLFLLSELLTSLFLFPGTIQSESMEPLLEPGTRLAASPLLYGPALPFTENRLRGVTRPSYGDLVFCAPLVPPREEWYRRLIDDFTGFFTLQKARPFGTAPYGPGNMTVRRVLALPGDTVRMEDYVVYIKTAKEEGFFPEYIMSGKDYRITKGQKPEEWPENYPLSGQMEEVTLEKDQYFLLYDNRTYINGLPHFALMSRDQLISRVLASYWPRIRFRF